MKVLHPETCSLDQPRQADAGLLLVAALWLWAGEGWHYPDTCPAWWARWTWGRRN